MALHFGSEIRTLRDIYMKTCGSHMSALSLALSELTTLTDPNVDVLQVTAKALRDCVKRLRVLIAIDGFLRSGKPFQIQMLSFLFAMLCGAGSRRTWNRTMRIGSSGLFTQSLIPICVR